MTTSDFIHELEKQIAMWGNVVDSEPDMAAAAIEAACAAIRKARLEGFADEMGYGKVCTNLDVSERQSTD